MGITARRIADAIVFYKAMFIGTRLSLHWLNHPCLYEHLAEIDYDNPHAEYMKISRKDGTLYEGLDVSNSIRLIRYNKQYSLELPAVIVITVVSYIGEALAQNQYFDKTPQLEFFRHLRNALSHGNKFHFRNDEPSRPAYFRTFRISRSLNGQPVLYEFMSLGDVLDLLDHVEAHLRKLS